MAPPKKVSGEDSPSHARGLWSGRMRDAAWRLLPHAFSSRRSSSPRYLPRHRADARASSACSPRRRSISRESGGYDLAMLVDNRDAGADLYLYFGVDPNAPEGATKPSFVKKNAAWVGGGAGTLPSLAVSDKGSLLIKSENDAIGRDRWTETLTVVRRNGALVVAGLTFTSRDTLEPRGRRLLRSQFPRPARERATARRSSSRRRRSSSPIGRSMARRGRKSATSRPAVPEFFRSRSRPKADAPVTRAC